MPVLQVSPMLVQADSLQCTEWLIIIISVSQLEYEPNRFYRHSVPKFFNDGLEVTVYAVLLLCS